MAKVILVLGLLFLAMVAAAADSEDKSGGDSSSNVVQYSLKVTSECKETDVFIMVEEFDGKPKKCKRKEKTDIGPFDLDLDLKHLLHLEFSFMNSKNTLEKADCIVDLLQLGLVDIVEDLLVDLVEDLVEKIVKCFLNGQLFLTIPL